MFVFVISADNIVLFPGSKGRVILVDFGVSKRFPVLEGNQTCGAQTHMSPEKARSLNYDDRSDVWAAICTLFQMMTGKGPWLEEYSHLSSLLYVVSMAKYK